MKKCKLATLLLLIPFWTNVQIAQITPKPAHGLFNDISPVVKTLSGVANYVSEAPKLDFLPIETPQIPKELLGLAKCESNLDPTRIHFNDGGSDSFGLFQWKIDSFYRYNLIYKIYPDIEKAEVRNIIMDEAGQIAMTKAVLATPDGWRNWTNCFKAMGFK